MSLFSVESNEREIVQRRNLVTDIPGPRSLDLHVRRSAAVSSGVGSSLPIYVARAFGAILEDVDGNSFIDLGSGIAVTGVGHAVPEITEAIATQAQSFTHTCFMVAPYEPYVAVCEELNELTPGSHQKASALFTSGAEAIENAVKIARRATGRQAVVVFDHSYHGRTNLTMALTSKNNPYKDGFGPFAPEIYRVPMSYPFRDPEGMTGDQAALRATEQIEAQIGAKNIACVLLEPIQGEGGFIVPAPGFLSAIATWCQTNDVLFVADEIQTGFGRTGQWFACENDLVVPDLVATAKGIAGGLPLSAVTGRSEIMNAVPVGGLGGTYGGSPIACAGAIASIRKMRAMDLPGAAGRIGEILSRRLGAMQEKFPEIGDVRGRGAMYTIEIVKRDSKVPDAESTRQIAAICYKNGVVVLTCGTYSNVIRLLPPFVIDPALLEEGLEVVEDALATVLGRNS